MKFFVRTFSLVFLLCNGVYASGRCYSKMSEVLDCFFGYNDGVYNYVLEEEKKISPTLTKKTYLLSSQKWPINNYKDIPSTVWQHRLIFYIPNNVSHKKALLYVNGGRNKDEKGKERWLSSLSQIDYGTIALDNEALVVELQTVPNQYLFFNNKSFKEDQFIAYTYKRVMDDSYNNAYLAGHLPMAKSILKAMDAIQSVSENEITKFVLAGASKRGWAVWLVSLWDDRIEAIIPINIDILNVKENISHICAFYGRCPIALRDYEKYDITGAIDSTSFANLIAVEDPYSYLQDDYDPKYKERLAIPKYIINSSGDDFTTPDSSSFYFKGLPGSANHIRYLPNGMHYLSGNPVSDLTDSLSAVNKALNSYFYFILHNISLPNVDWKLAKDSIEVVSSVKPSKVKFWMSNNDERCDFRLFSGDVKPFFIPNIFWKLNFLREGYTYWQWSKKEKKAKDSSDIFDLCDNCFIEREVDFSCDDGVCKIKYLLPDFKIGCQASFIELHYNIEGRDFIVTTEVDIEQVSDIYFEF